MSSVPVSKEWGPLDDEGQKVFDFLKSTMVEEKTDPMPSDELLKMHVLGYHHIKDRKNGTLEKLRAVLKLRKEFALDTVCDRDFAKGKSVSGHDLHLSEAEILKIWTLFIYGRDPDGHPIFYDNVGNLEVAKVVELFVKSEQQIDCMKEFYFMFLERLNKVKRRISKENGKMILKQVAVLDMNGASISSINKCKELMKQVIGGAQLLWPESLHKMYLINTGWFFRACWNIISLFVDKQTQKKITLVGSDWIKAMEKDGIARDQIPKAWGGDGTMDIIYGRDAQGYDKPSNDDLTLDDKNDDDIKLDDKTDDDIKLE